MKRFVLLIFSLFMFVICLVSVARDLSNSPQTSDYPFEEFVQYLSDAPKIEANPEFIDFTITDDWGLLEPVKILINFTIGTLNFVAYLGQCVANAVVYIVYFVRYIFLGGNVNIGNIPAGDGPGHLGGR